MTRNLWVALSWTMFLYGQLMQELNAELTVMNYATIDGFQICRVLTESKCSDTPEGVDGTTMGRCSEFCRFIIRSQFVQQSNGLELGHS